MTPRPQQERRHATAEEFAALGHPLRLQILRLCLHDSRTNQELAAALGADPATVLHHVRRLLAVGLLAAAKPVRGPRGPLIKPYRATGRSWGLTAEDFPGDVVLRNQLAMIDAARAEVASRPEPADHLVRLGLRLTPEAAEELHHRLWSVIHEYAHRPPDAQGQKYGLLAVLHRQPTIGDDSAANPD